MSICMLCVIFTFTKELLMFGVKCVVLRLIKMAAVPLLVKMSPNDFLSSIARKFESMPRYEDPALHAAVLADVPVATLEFRAQERMRALQKQIKKDGSEDLNVTIQEMLLLEALEWFKTWMEWVNAPECDNCDGETKFSHISSDISYLQSSGADRIEMYRCTDPSCASMTSFERHSDPGRAWEAQRGRCGEWAAAFTLLCRALKWEARLISDATDHAWTEVYSIGQSRWLHTDPCENICDQPLIYETGWGKKLSYIIAYSYDDLQDVTWRYSSKHKDVLKNRTMCSELDLLDLIVNLRDLKQNRFSFARRKYLAKRTAMELVEMMTEKQSTTADNQGRTSGSLAWRLQRGETKVTQQTIWRPTLEDLSIGQMTIRYSIIEDHYERLSGNKVTETVPKWENGVFSADGMFRKEEKDWKMVYLCRQESATEGKIQWRFSAASGTKIRKVSVRCLNQTFENGRISLTLTGNDKTVEFSSSLETEEFSGCEDVTMAAHLTGGQGDCAWQHAQLFRQPLNAPEFPLVVSVTFQ